MNNEFKRMIKLAGLTEIKVNQPSSTNKNATIKDDLKGWLKHQLAEFDTHPGNPYWEGIDIVLKHKKVYDSILNRLQETIKEENPEDEDDYDSLEMMLFDLIELEVMDYFWEFFIENLQKNEIDIEPEAFDLLDFHSDIAENIYLNFEDFIEDGDYSVNTSDDLSSPEAFQRFMDSIPNKKYFYIFDEDDYSDWGDDLVDVFYDPIFDNELKGKPGIEGDDFTEWMDIDREKNPNDYGIGVRERMLYNKIRDIITSYNPEYFL